MTVPGLAALRALSADGPLRVRVSGCCMAPALADRATVGVRRARLFCPGDVIAFLAGDRLTAHRVIGYRPSRGGLLVWTQADGATTPDAPVRPDRVLGVVVDVRASWLDRLRAVKRLLRHVAARAAARLG